MRGPFERSIQVHLNAVTKTGHLNSVRRATCEVHLVPKFGRMGIYPRTYLYMTRIELFLDLNKPAQLILVFPIVSMVFNNFSDFQRTVLDTQEELWEPPLHGAIASEYIIIQGVRTARVRRFKGPYSGAEFNVPVLSGLEITIVIQRGGQIHF